MSADQITLLATLCFATGFGTALLVVLTVYMARTVRSLDAGQLDKGSRP